jgi:flagellar hook-associated protein 2
MATNLNLNNLTVDPSGRASFSGLGTGIDFQGAVDSIIKAKHIPIDQIEQRISDNQAKIAALQDLRTHALALQTAADKLRGKISFDGSANIFEAKQAFATVSRADSQAPSAPDSLISVAVTNAAQATSHTIEVQQIATAHKVASGTIAAGLNDPLGLSGSFQINFQTITADPTDTPLGLRDRINAANAGANPTGVTASIVSISATQQVLILTANKTGTDAAITASDTSGSVLQGLGVIDGSGAFQSELQPAQNAEIKVDGLGTTLERQSNTIDDAFTGVTLNLFKAEPGTTVNVDVERDLNQVKSAIVDFVDAYNELRTYINQQAETNVPADDETGAGVLAGTSALSDARSQLSAAVGAAVDGADPIFSVLAQIGITIQAPSQVSDPTQANTLAIDETKLDDALLNQTAAVRSLFSFQMSSSSPDAVLAGFDGNTSFTAGGYTLNVAYSGGAVVSANINGAADGSDDGSVAVNGNVLKVVSGGAKGLQMLYTGTSSASGIQLDLSVGVGAKLYNAVGGLVDDSTGLVTNEVNNLTSQNDLGQERIDRLQARLDHEHDQLLARFAAMETAVTTMNQLLESLKQQTSAAFGNSSNG